MSEHENRSAGGDAAAPGSDRSDAVRQDPWACYEEGADFCAAEGEAEACCCCCC
jgi:hypothetical protein